MGVSIKAVVTQSGEVMWLDWKTQRTEHKTVYSKKYTHALHFCVLLWFGNNQSHPLLSGSLHQAIKSTIDGEHIVLYDTTDISEE